MTKLSRVLWSISVLFIVIAFISFSLGIVVVGIALAVVWSLYRRFISKKGSAKYDFNKKGYSYVDIEVRDVTPKEPIKLLTEVKSPEQFRRK